MVANLQQTDTVQQFLAYEKCYKITGGYENCVAAHEPLSYTDKYPITKNSWVALNGGRMAEIALAPGESRASREVKTATVDLAILAPCRALPGRAAATEMRGVARINCHSASERAILQVRRLILRLACFLLMLTEGSA